MAYKRSAFGSVATVNVNWEYDDHEDLGPAHSLRRVDGRRVISAAARYCTLTLKPK